MDQKVQTQQTHRQHRRGRRAGVPALVREAAVGRRRTAGARKGRQCRVLSAYGRRRRDGADDGAGCALGKRGPPGTERAGRQRAGMENGADLPCRGSRGAAVGSNSAFRLVLWLSAFGAGWAAARWGLCDAGVRGFWSNGMQGLCPRCYVPCYCSSVLSIYLSIFGNLI